MSGDESAIAARLRTELADLERVVQRAGHLLAKSIQHPNSAA